MKHILFYGIADFEVMLFFRLFYFQTRALFNSCFKKKVMSLDKTGF